MIIIQLAGGLGNQMQQYALYEKFKSMGVPVKLDISWYTKGDRQAAVYARRELELNLFQGITYEICTEAEKRELTGREDIFGKAIRKLLPGRNKVFRETEMYHPELLSFRDRYLIGYFACENYYHDILPDLRQKLIFPEQCGQSMWQIGDRAEETSQLDQSSNINKDISKLNRETMKAMKEENAVSVHIRRGDYLDPENRQMFGDISTEAYYDSAIHLIRERFNHPVFYFFSDDTDYIRKTYREEDCRIVDWNQGKNNFYDIMLMSSCSHNICANSTFSFWGARLNEHEDKLMIRPSIHKNSQTFEPEKMHELWKDWILIDPMGNVV